MTSQISRAAADAYRDMTRPTWIFIPAVDDSVDPEYRFSGNNKSVQVCFDNEYGKTYFYVIESSPEGTPDDEIWIRDCGEFQSLKTAQAHVERGHAALERFQS